MVGYTDLLGMSENVVIDTESELMLLYSLQKYLRVNFGDVLYFDASQVSIASHLFSLPLFSFVYNSGIEGMDVYAEHVDDAADLPGGCFTYLLPDTSIVYNDSDNMLRYSLHWQSLKIIHVSWLLVDVFAIYLLRRLLLYDDMSLSLCIDLTPDINVAIRNGTAKNVKILQYKYRRVLSVIFLFDSDASETELAWGSWVALHEQWGYLNRPYDIAEKWSCFRSTFSVGDVAMLHDVRCSYQTSVKMRLTSLSALDPCIIRKIDFVRNEVTVQKFSYPVFKSKKDLLDTYTDDTEIVGSLSLYSRNEVFSLYNLGVLGCFFGESKWLYTVVDTDATYNVIFTVNGAYRQFYLQLTEYIYSVLTEYGISFNRDRYRERYFADGRVLPSCIT